MENFCQRCIPYQTERPAPNRPIFYENPPPLSTTFRESPLAAKNPLSSPILKDPFSLLCCSPTVNSSLNRGEIYCRGGGGGGGAFIDDGPFIHTTTNFRGVEASSMFFVYGRMWLKNKVPIRKILLSPHLSNFTLAFSPPNPAHPCSSGHRCSGLRSAVRMIREEDRTCCRRRLLGARSSAPPPPSPRKFTWAKR